VRVSLAALRILEHLEGFEPKPYKDGRGYSIGFGHQIRPGEDLTEVTVEEGRELLLRDVGYIEERLEKLVQRSLGQHQWDALVLFTYNVGVDNLIGTNTLAAINEERDGDVPDWIKKWNKTRDVDGNLVKNNSLTRRRAFEAEIWQGLYDLNLTTHI